MFTDAFVTNGKEIYVLGMAAFLATCPHVSSGTDGESQISGAAEGLLDWQSLYLIFSIFSCISLSPVRNLCGYNV